MAASFTDTFYGELRRAYDATIDRRKTLTNQASSLIGFAGVVQTVLASLIVAFATNGSARQTIESIADYKWVLGGVVAGLVAFILAAIFALLAFHEERWFRVPYLPGSDPNWVIQKMLDSGGPAQLKLFAYQLNDATKRHQHVNDFKFKMLMWAQIAVAAGILSVGIVGILVLASL